MTIHSTPAVAGPLPMPETPPDCRLIRKLQPVEAFHERRDQTPLRFGVVVDVETTGLDRHSDRIIELALQRFSYDLDGRIVEVEEPQVWREDPRRPLDPRITLLTGLTQSDLEGQRIDEAQAREILASADLVIAHNAGFDRPFVDQRLPSIHYQAWACTMAEIDWLDLGFDGRSLGHLLYQMGWFYDAHRAENDILALLYLLAHQLPDETTVLSKLLAASQTPSVRVNAFGAPFEVKDRLKARQYRWDPARRVWSKDIPLAAEPEEREWLESDIYLGRYAEPEFTPITACERYR